MARQFQISARNDAAAAADNAFPPEAEVFPAETAKHPPTIIDVANDEESLSLFLPEAPSAVVVRAGSPPRRSVFAYDPDLIVNHAPARAASGGVPAVLDAWPLSPPRRIQSAPSPWRWTVAVAVVLAVCATVSFFAVRLITSPGTTLDEPRVVLAPKPSPDPPAERPFVGTSPPRQAVIPPAIRSAQEASKPPRPATSIPTAPVTRKPVPAAPGPVVAQEPVAPAATQASSVSVNASPSTTAVPPIARVEPPRPGPAVEPTRAIEASPVAPSAPPPAPAPAPAPAARPSESASVEAVLTKYRAAFASLDVNAVQAIWPSVNARALGNAFQQLQTQTFEFDDCQIEVNGARASAVCRGRASFVPVVGSKSSRVESRRWMFQLARGGGSWILERVESR